MDHGGVENRGDVVGGEAVGKVLGWEKGSVFAGLVAGQGKGDSAGVRNGEVQVGEGKVNTWQ